MRIGLVNDFVTDDVQPLVSFESQILVEEAILTILPNLFQTLSGWISYSFFQIIVLLSTLS